ncbi:MAG: S9 family peptidase [candidate division Zixibacteria bacterium]|nr:S9 family peptidase [candidate division Zixibacteria bacterium]
MRDINQKRIPKIKYTFDQLASVRRMWGYDFSPDGKRMALVTDLDGQFNLWHLPTTGGFPVQLTFFKDQAVRNVKWSPVSNQIAFTVDEKGNELEQIYLLDLDAGGRPRPLTDNPKKRYYLSAWSPDGRFIYYTTDDRNPMALDVGRIEVSSGKREKITQEDARFYAQRPSPDGRYLPIIEFFANDHYTLHLLELSTGKRWELTPHTGKVRFDFRAWSPDSRFIYALTDEESEFLHLIKIDIMSGEKKVFAAPEWDVVEAATSNDGRWVAYVVNRGGFQTINLRDLNTGKERSIDEDLKALHLGCKFTTDCRFLAFKRNQAIRAGDYYLFNLENGDIQRITDSMSGGVRSKDLISPELIEYQSFDRKIPAWFYRPKGEGPFPCVLSIHGGPESQEVPFYYHFYQYLLQAGIAVLAPNIRGSTGYGKAYMRLIHRDWGGGELKDIEAAAQFLRDHPEIDKDRIAIYGGSFGGFAVLSAVTRLPDLWSAAADICGPSNLVTFLKSVPEFWKPIMKEWLGDINDPEDRKFLLERSPISYIDQAKTPIFIIQGANDPRVVKGESDQIVDVLQKKGIPVEYMVFEDEGHGFTKTENAIRGWKKAAHFFFEHLLEQIPEVM